MSFELSKSNESSLSFVWIIIKIPIHKRTAEPINSQTLLDKKFFKINPINPEKIVTIIETINNIILSNLDNFVFLSPYVIPIPKESILLEIFYHLLIFYENVEIWWIFCKKEIEY